MIYDRSRYYFIAFGAAFLVVLVLYIANPRVTAEQRVQEQLAILASMPWTQIQVDDVQSVGQQVLVRGRRLKDGKPVLIGFLGSTPYTSPATIQSLTEKPIAGLTADVVMLPRSLAYLPYRSQADPTATHVGVALYADVPERADTATPTPLESGSMEGAMEPTPVDAAAAHTTDG